MQDGMVFVKTPVSRRSFSATWLQDTKVGDELTLLLDAGNIIVEVHKKGEPFPVHRFVTGNLNYADADRNEIRLWTPQGIQAFMLQVGRNKLSVLQQGEPVTLELNETHKVIGILRIG